MNGARNRQRGVALIVALLVVALATVLIAALLDRGQLAAARTRNTLREMQAESYAKGLEDYAAHVLGQDSNSIDATDDIWAIPLPPTPVPGGEISATMIDLNGRFNLNNLSTGASNASVWTDRFTALLTALKLDPNLTQNVVDWMNADTATGGGDAWYVAQPVPYRSAKRIFSHVSELRLVKGFDGDVYAQISPYVAALPVNTTINLNTASVSVLRTLGWTDQDAAAVWSQGHAHYQDWTSLPPQYQHPPTSQIGFGFRSSYFLARCDVTLDGLPFTFYSLIERGAGSATSAGNAPRVLLRNRGGD